MVQMDNFKANSKQSLINPLKLFKLFVSIQIHVKLLAVILDLCFKIQNTRLRDIPRVTLIKGSEIDKNVQVLTGYCPSCQTTYLADHERVLQDDNRHTRVYLNSAKYLKVGQSLWVDRVFSNAVVNVMYSFHASASAFTEFWNNSFYNHQQGNSRKLSHRQIWQAFVQESIRSIASASEINLELQDGLAISDVTKQAFSILGENGLIRAADQHTCQE